MVNLVDYLSMGIACSLTNRNDVIRTDPLTLLDQYTFILSEIGRKDMVVNSQFPQLLRNRYEHGLTFHPGKLVFFFFYK